MQMSRMLKTLQTLQELLEDGSHVMRFHSLRSQGEVVPWVLQLTFRDTEAWTLLNSLTQSTVWCLLGMAFKSHTQTQSKQAALLASLVGKGKGVPPSKGKGKHKQQAKKEK